MDKNSNRGFFDMEEAAEFLKCGDKDVLHLVREKKIPHSVLPFGKVLFDRDRLRDWVLSFEQMPEYRMKVSTFDKNHKVSLGKEIIQRFGQVYQPVFATAGLRTIASETYGGRNRFGIA